MDHTQTDSIIKGSRGVWLLAWPSILTNLLYATGSIVAIKVVGNFGPNEVAAAITGQRITFVIQAILSGILAGTTALVARNWGAKKFDEANLFVTNTFQLVAFISLVSSIVIYQFADEISYFFALEGDAFEYSSAFLRAISPFYLFFGIGIGLITALRAIGDVKTPLLIALIMNLSGIFLMVSLSNGYFGLYNFGYLGAAIGNGISYLLGALILIMRWSLGYLKSSPTNLLIYDPNRTKQIFKIGYPSALEQIIFQVGITAFLILIAYYGTAAYAAYGIGVQILSFSFVIGFSFSIAGATLVGQHLGAADLTQAKRSGWGAMRLSILSMTIFGIIIVFFAEPLSRFMIDDEEVIRLSVIFIWLMGSMQPLMAIEFSLGGALRGAGDTRSPLLITLTALLFIRVTLASILFYFSAPIEYIFASLLADYLVKGFMYVWVFKSERWVHAIKD